MCSYNPAIQLCMSFSCLMDVLGMQLGLVGTGQQKKKDSGKTKWWESRLLKNDKVKKRLSLHSGQVAHQAGAYSGFCSMKRLGVFLLPPGWDASPSQGYPQH